MASIEPLKKGSSLSQFPGDGQGGYTNQKLHCGVNP
jgi:hypothetical protein